MRGQRPPASKKGTQRAVQASVTREKRSTATPATSKTSAPAAYRQGLSQYSAPTLQQPPQRWLRSSMSKTPFPLEPSDEQGPWTGVTSADASAILAGIGEFNADAAVVRPQP